MERKQRFLYERGFYPISREVLFEPSMHSMDFIEAQSILIHTVPDETSDESANFEEVPQENEAFVPCKSVALPLESSHQSVLLENRQAAAS